MSRRDDRTADDLNVEAAQTILARRRAIVGRSTEPVGGPDTGIGADGDDRQRGLHRGSVLRLPPEIWTPSFARGHVDALDHLAGC